MKGRKERGRRRGEEPRECVAKMAGYIGIRSWDREVKSRGWRDLGQGAGERSPERSQDSGTATCKAETVCTWINRHNSWPFVLSFFGT